MKYPSVVLYRFEPLFLTYEPETITFEEALIQELLKQNVNIQPAYIQIGDFVKDEDGNLFDYHGNKLPIIECNFPEEFDILQKKYQEKTGMELPDISKRANEIVNRGTDELCYFYNNERHRISYDQYVQLDEMRKAVMGCDNTSKEDADNGVYRSSSLLCDLKRNGQRWQRVLESLETNVNA